MTDEFSVFVFFPDGYHIAEAKFVDAQKAVRIARSITERPSAYRGLIARVIITDGGDCIAWEWKYGQGITFPKAEAL